MKRKTRLWLYITTVLLSALNEGLVFHHLVICHKDEFMFFLLVPLNILAIIVYTTMILKLLMENKV
jgi:hypothetical protein